MEGERCKNPLRAPHRNVSYRNASETARHTTWGAFLFHKPLQEAAAIMTQYDLVIVDEVSMLTAAQFERICALWNNAEQLPAVVLLGDFCQLPVVDPNAARASRALSGEKSEP